MNGAGKRFDPASRTTFVSLLSGFAEYNGDQIRVELSFSPETEQERRAVYEAESVFVTHFEYANLPGHAVVSVAGDEVKAEIYTGASRQLWTEVNLSQMMKG